MLGRFFAVPYAPGMIWMNPGVFSSRLYEPTKNNGFQRGNDERALKKYCGPRKKNCK
jgi:hypothetical protein